MSIIRYIKRLKYIDYLINRKATGNLEVFSKKNRLSKSAMSEVLNEMKEMGFPIKYDRVRGTYYYNEPGEMIQSLFLRYGEVLTNENPITITSIEKLCFSPTAIFEICEDKV